MNYLQQKSFRINHLTDKDRLKHISCPSKLSVQHKNCKIIYVYNKTFDAICSHYRRNWAVTQMRKINTKNNLSGWVHTQLLSSSKTRLIIKETVLKKRPLNSSKNLARLFPNLLIKVKKCKMIWE